MVAMTTSPPPGWSEELVAEAWDNNVVETCNRAGLDVDQVFPGAGSEMSLTGSKATSSVRQCACEREGEMHLCFYSV